MKKYILLPLLAVLLLAGAANAAVIGSITHDYGIGEYESMTGGTLQDEFITIGSPNDFQDSFDFTGFKYDAINAYTVAVTFTGNYMGYSRIGTPYGPITYPNEFWAVSPGTPLADEPLFGSGLSTVAGGTIVTDVMTFTWGSYSTLEDMLNNGIFELLFSNLGYVDDGELDVYAVTVTALGTPTPIPGAVWLFGSGLVGLVGIRRRMKA